MTDLAGASPAGPPVAGPAGELFPTVRQRQVRRWRLTAGVFLIYLVYALPDLFAVHSRVRIAAGALLIVAFVLLYLGALPLGMFHGHAATVRWLPAAMAVVSVAYLLLIGPDGLIFTTYLCVAVVVLMRPVISVPLVTALCAGVIFLPRHVDGWGMHHPQWSVGAPAVLVSIAMYGLRANNRRQTELYQARAEVERLAADQERLRIARDLHDLLGHALTTVVVKAELASRLVGRDTERAAREMTEVAELARQALADVRATVAGYREVSLVTELATAREVLRAAGIEAELPAAVDSVSGDLRELFGWVIREGVTNVVRHSRAAHVRIRLLDRAIEVVDDGFGANGERPATNHPTRGSGLTGLAERVAAAGGRVTAGSQPGGGWRLRVEVPP